MSIYYLLAVLIQIAIYQLIQTQTLLRQYINDAHHIQTHARRINIPYLKAGLRTDSREGFKEVPVKTECPKCPDQRYVQHYLVKGCVPVFKAGCDCPSRYDCSLSQHLRNSSSSVCWHNRRKYKIGERVVISNPCRICECRFNGIDALSADIDCTVQVECTQQTEKIHESCYKYYTPDECCPRIECSPENTNRTARSSKSKLCNYNGVQYRLGERIQLKSNSNCLSCVCTEEWDDDNPLDNYSCKKLSCDMELEPKLKSGCTPVYHENQCCAVDYQCPKRIVHRIQGLDSGSLMCSFEGRKYPIDSKLFLNNKCINCVCLVPPDFTCIHKANCV